MSALLTASLHILIALSPNVLTKNSVLTDYGKNALNLIFGHYLMNIKKLSYDDAFKIIKRLIE
jgi:hypothetical protein